MDYRKINSHIILLLIVVIVGVLTGAIVRYVTLSNGADVGTANITFLIALGVSAVIYLIIVATLSHVIIPWIMKKLPERKSVEDNQTTEVAEEKPVAESEDWREQHNKQTTARIELFLEYTHLALGAYVTKDELARLDDYIERYAREIELPKDIVPIKPERLKNPDLFHFGWNMAHYFGQQKQEVVPWLQSVFTELRELEYSYIKGKLHDHQTKRYIIPNVDDIPKYLAGKKL